MKKLICIITILLSNASLCVAADAIDNNAIWQKGNDFYRKKIYDSASACFEQIAALKPQNKEVYYNLGNAYYKLNKIGLAVLNYERALKLDPEYKDAKENLMLTQSRISNRINYLNDIFFIVWWNGLTRPDKAGMWAVLALVVFVITICILLVRRYDKSIGPRLPVQLPFITGFFWLCFLLIAIVAVNKHLQKNDAVIMVNNSPLMNADLAGKPLILIPEGTKVSIISNKTTWVEVRLPDGSTGWVQQNILEKI